MKTSFPLLFHRIAKRLSEDWRSAFVLRIALILLAAGLSAYGFTPLTADQLVFFNADHAPIGAGSTLAYGYKGDVCGLGMSSSGVPKHFGGGGVVIGLKSSAGLQVMPFLLSAAKASSTATYFPDASVQRALGPGTDTWNVQSGALTWTHYSPAWKMPSLSTATPAEKSRFFLPATWMVFTVNNSTAQTEDFYFGLPATATQTSYANGAYQGFSTGEAALAVKAGSCDLLSGSGLTAALNGMTTGFAFHMSVPPGQTKSLTVAVAYYRSTPVDTRIPASYYYTTLFKSMDSVIDTAMATLTDAQIRCQQLATAMTNSGINVYRQFLASHALHSYQSCTFYLTDAAGNGYWRENEGDYSYINTFDLTVDHAFYDSVMHPWALRNVLDAMSGFSNGGVGYTFDHPLYDAASGTQMTTSGLSFHHDMGNGITSAAPTVDPCSYENSFAYMGQEQMQNWILCAGLYWSRSGDNSWVTGNLATLQNCFTSMLLRDNGSTSGGDGITSYVNRKSATNYEITTYDSLDASLKQPQLSGRTTVRSWACYLALQAMFTQAGDLTNAAAAGNMASVCAATIVSKWNTYQPTLGYIPAFLDGSNTAGTIPLVEGLAIVQQMGINTSGFSTMLADLKAHLTSILVTGRCLDATTGAWKLTSANTNTWASKVYLCQYIAENILGITGNNVNGTIDQVHATLQVQEGPFQGFTDQLNSSTVAVVNGSLHYPRGITSALWWLTPATNPAFPTPTVTPGAPTGLAARTSIGQTILTWNSPGLAASYNVARATAVGGPYTTIATGITGASFVDFTINKDGTSYYTVSATNSVGTGAASTPLAVATTQGRLVSPWAAQDLGSVSIAGSNNCCPDLNTVGLVASGTDIAGSSDNFRYVYQPLNGNGSIVARVASIGNSNAWAKTGVMIRNSLNTGDKEASLVLTPGNGIQFQSRTTLGANTSTMQNTGLTAPYWLKLVRNGTAFTASQSPDGVTWTAVGTATITMGTSVYIGLAAVSHDNTKLNTSIFDNIAVTGLPAGWAAQDMGSTALAGNTGYSPTGAFTISGSGSDIQGGSDNCQFASQSASGDCSILARVGVQGTANDWAKTGVMIRNSTTASDLEVSMLVTPVNGVTFQWRTTAGSATTYTPNPGVKGVMAPCWLEVVRTGNTFTGLASADGINWSTIGTATVAMGTNVKIGLAASAHDNTKLNTSTINNVIVSQLPAGWTAQDVGSTALAGSTYYSPDGTYTITGSGADIGGTADAGQFAGQSITGDCTIVARVADMESSNGSAKAGVMIRNSLTASDMEASVFVTPSNGVTFQWRATSGGGTSNLPNPAVPGATAPYWVKLVRTGNSFTGYQSADGAIWTAVGSATVAMGGTVNVGLAGTSHDNAQLNTATIDNVLVSALPSGWATQDIGSTGVAGSAYYSPGASTFTISGSGGDIQGGSDAFRYAYQTVSGNCTIVARVASTGAVNAWAKAGIMIRNSLTASDMEMSVLVTPGNGISFQSRTTSGGGTTYAPNPAIPGIGAPYWVKLVRSGSTFTASQSPDGSAWTTIGTATATMGTTVDIGLAAGSHDNTRLNTSTMDNVTVSSP